MKILLRDRTLLVIVDGSDLMCYTFMYLLNKIINKTAQASTINIIFRLETRVL